jgi:hypothetical protein
MIHDGLLVVGIGCIATAAFMVSVPLGLAVTGAPMVIVALSKKSKSEPKNAS